jgi:putative toxin-antitoxin system antitoxin component (TIGR02293 family)
MARNVIPKKSARRARAAAAPQPGDPMIDRVVDYLGGPRVLRKHPRSAAEVHDLIVIGLPGETIARVVDRTQHLNQQKVANALGISARTIQRRRVGSAKLSPEQGGKAWTFSELMVRAAAVLGGEREAERWFDTPALALDQRRPIDLLGSPVGAALVGELLGRMEYGVYT